MSAPASAREGTPEPKRRRLLELASGALGGAGLLGAVPPSLQSVAWAGGSDAPEKKEVRIGFIPLTDCASVVMASVLGFDRKYGVQIVPTKEASWASVRDKLLNNDIDFAHVLYGLVYGVQAGVGGPKRDMAVLMTLNRNGQGISLSKKLAGQGVVDGASLAKRMATEKRGWTFAQTFPTGTHAMWLYYWLAAHGVHPFRDARTIVVPPPQMIANVRIGNMDGFCVGEPWNHRGIVEGVSVSVAQSQDVWQDHPEKVLGATRAFVEANPNTCRAVTMAVLEASRWIDENAANKQKMADTIAQPAFVNCAREVIVDRILGQYEDGMGRRWNDPHHMKFHDDGEVNYPYLSDGMWFLTQHRRWRLLKDEPDYLGLARQVNQTALYREAAAQLKIPVPASEMRRSTLVDGVVWDGSDPALYAASFDLSAA